MTLVEKISNISNITRVQSRQVERLCQHILSRSYNPPVTFVTDDLPDNFDEQKPYPLSKEDGVGITIRSIISTLGLLEETKTQVERLCKDLITQSKICFVDDTVSTIEPTTGWIILGSVQIGSAVAKMLNISPLDVFGKAPTPAPISYLDNPNIITGPVDHFASTATPPVIKP
jgi:hypothetical protein